MFFGFTDLLGYAVGTLKKSCFWKDQHFESMLYAAQVTHVDHSQAVELVKARVLKP